MKGIKQFFMPYRVVLEYVALFYLLPVVPCGAQGS